MADVGQDAVRRTIGQLIADEDGLTRLLDAAPAVAAAHAGAAALLDRCREQARAHRAALAASPHHSGDGGSAGVSPALPADAPVTEVLQTLGAEVNRVALGYAMLHARSHRIFDRTTAGLAEAHLRDYAGSAQAIGALISAVTVWELIGAGQACQCQCPACGLGVCVCLVHGADTVERAWRETGPPAEAGGVVVLPPRAGSPAAVAGVVTDDVVIGVDGTTIENHLQLGSAIQAHTPGQVVHLRVRRGLTDERDVVATRPGPRPTGD